MPISRDDVFACLKTVPGPDGTTALADYAGLSEIVVGGGKVFFSIEVPAERAAALETMRAAAEAAVKRLPGVTSVVAALTAHAAGGPRAQASEASGGASGGASGAGRAPGHQGGHSHRHEPPAAGGLEHVRQIVAVASGKGGVGKSTTSANLALALRGAGLRVGLLDADVFGPSVPRLFGITGRPEMDENNRIVPFEAEGIRLMSVGFLVDEAAAMIWRGPMVMSAVGQLLRDVAWGDLDVLVIDMPPGTGDVQLTIAQQARLAGAVIVSTPQDLALIDARRGVAMFEKVEVPVLGVVENMSYFVCPNCGTRHDIFAHGGARDEAERLGVPFLGEIPLAMTIRETSDAGRPVVVSAPNGPHAAVYRQIAAAVIERLGSGSLVRPAPAIVFE
jgi:ATP-binding protein involved in chromosome partitioning